MRRDAGGVSSDSRGGFRASITRDGVRTQPRGASVEAVSVRLHAVDRDVELEAAENRREQLRAVSWEAAAEVWLTMAGHAPATRDGYRKRMRTLARVAPWWTSPVATTTHADVQRFLDGLRTRAGSPASSSIRRGCLAVLRGAAAAAVRYSQFGVVTDPTAGLRISAGPSPKPSADTFTGSEVERIFVAAARRDQELRWLLALHFGLRASEALALEDDDLADEGDSQVIRVRATLVRLSATPTVTATWARQSAQAEQRIIPIEVESRIGQALAVRREVLTARRRARPAPTAKQVRESQGRALAFGRAVRAGAFGPAELRLPSGLLFPHPVDVTRPTPDDRDAATWRALLSDAGVAFRPRSAARLYAERRLLELLDDDAVAAAVLGTTPETLLRRHPDVLSTRMRSAMRRITP